MGSGGGWEIEGSRRYQAANGAGIMGGIVGFARYHLRSSIILLVKIVMIERVEETAHQNGYIMSIIWSGG